MLNDVLTNVGNVVRKGRLGPGQTVCADLAAGEFQGEHADCQGGVDSLATALPHNVVHPEHMKTDCWVSLSWEMMRIMQTCNACEALQGRCSC